MPCCTHGIGGLHQLDFHAILHQQFRVAVAEHVVLVASDGDGARLLRPAADRFAFRQDVAELHAVGLHQRAATASGGAGLCVDQRATSVTTR